MNRPVSLADLIDGARLGRRRVWSPERVALLQLHYLQGMAAAESARLIGLTRNAVISKRYRLGLFGRAVSDRPRSRPSKPLKTGDAVRPFWFSPREDLMAVEPLPAMDLPPPPDARPSILADRPARTCGWPLGPAEDPGDATSLFCCAPVVGRKSYCTAHLRRSLRAPLNLSDSPPGAFRG